jgi:hypothetical protein
MGSDAVELLASTAMFESTRQVCEANCRLLHIYREIERHIYGVVSPRPRM